MDHTWSRHKHIYTHRNNSPTWPFKWVCLICLCEMFHDDILSDVLFLMKVTFPLMFRSQLSFFDVLWYPAWNCRSTPRGLPNCISLMNAVPWHPWQMLIHSHHIAEMSKCPGHTRKWKTTVCRLLTFQILFSPANGRLTSGVSAVAGNWHAWLPPPADWKLNISFVSQGWAFIQSWLGIHSNASCGFDFMQKRGWTHT